MAYIDRVYVFQDYGNVPNQIIFDESFLNIKNGNDLSIDDTYTPLEFDGTDYYFTVDKDYGFQDGFELRIKIVYINNEGVKCEENYIYGDEIIPEPDPPPPPPPEPPPPPPEPPQIENGGFLTCDEVVEGTDEYSITIYQFNLDGSQEWTAFDLQFKDRPKKAEILSGSTIVASSGMDAAGNYGDPTDGFDSSEFFEEYPDGVWYIGNDKGTIPNRVSEFQTDINDTIPMSASYQQRLWWKHGKISGTITLKITGQGTYSFKTTCPPEEVIVPDPPLLSEWCAKTTVEFADYLSTGSEGTIDQKVISDYKGYFAIVFRPGSSTDKLEVLKNNNLYASTNEYANGNFGYPTNGIFDADSGISKVGSNIIVLDFDVDGVRILEEEPRGSGSNTYGSDANIWYVGGDGTNGKLLSQVPSRIPEFISFATSGDTADIQAVTGATNNFNQIVYFDVDFNDEIIIRTSSKSPADFTYLPFCVDFGVPAPVIPPTIYQTETNLQCDQWYGNNTGLPAGEDYDIIEYPFTLENPSGNPKYAIFDVAVGTDPQRFEIIHNGIKRATTSMNANGNYTDINPSTGITTGDTTFIGTVKGSIPERITQFTGDTNADSIDTAFKTMSTGMVQRIWWEYTNTEYNLTTTAFLRVTSETKQKFSFIRLCEPVIEPEPPVVPFNEGSFICEDVKNQQTTSGNAIIEYTINLDKPEILGEKWIAFDLDPKSQPQKFEIFHNGIKVANSNMLPNSNSSNFDPTTGITTDAQTTDAYIGTNKGNIPTNISNFQIDTGSNITLTSGYEQRIWWKYELADWNTSQFATIRITGLNTDGYNIKRICPPKIVPLTTNTYSTLSCNGELRIKNSVPTSPNAKSADFHEISFNLKSGGGVLAFDINNPNSSPRIKAEIIHDGNKVASTNRVDRGSGTAATNQYIKYNSDPTTFDPTNDLSNYDGGDWYIGTLSQFGQIDRALPFEEVTGDDTPISYTKNVQRLWWVYDSDDVSTASTAKLKITSKVNEGSFNITRICPTLKLNFSYLFSQIDWDGSEWVRTDFLAEGNTLTAQNVVLNGTTVSTNVNDTTFGGNNSDVRGNSTFTYTNGATAEQFVGAVSKYFRAFAEVGGANLLNNGTVDLYLVFLGLDHVKKWYKAGNDIKMVSTFSYGANSQTFTYDRKTASSIPLNPTISVGSNLEDFIIDKTDQTGGYQSNVYYYADNDFIPVVSTTEDFGLFTIRKVNVPILPTEYTIINETFVDFGSGYESTGKVRINFFIKPPTYST